MTRDELFLLRDIVENIDDIEQFSQGLSREALEKSRLKLKAIVRSLEIIGEAAKNVSSSTKTLHPEVEWKRICGARDVFIHSYFDIDIEIVWRVIKDKLPGLKRQIQSIIKEMEAKKATTSDKKQ